LYISLLSLFNYTFAPRLDGYVGATKTLSMIQAVNRALDMLEYIAKQEAEWVQLKDVADALGLNHSTCANLMKTLLQRGYLEKAVGQRGYKVGPMPKNLYRDKATPLSRLIDAAKKPMSNLVSTLHEGCILTILDENNRIIVYEEKAEQELQVINVKRKPAYDSSTGRMLLASLKKKDVLELVEQYGLPNGESWPEVQDSDELLYELIKIRKRGYAQQTSKRHITGFAMAVEWDGIVAALGVYMPEIRLNQAFEDKILERMRMAIEEIENGKGVFAH